MKIKIIQVGKNKDRYIEEANNEYLKRLSQYADMDIIVLKEVSPSKSYPVEKCIKEESSEILSALKPDDFVVVLDENGKTMDSIGFSDFIKNQKDLGIGITFVIGGAFGMSQELKSRANLLLSFSKMTFTHQMIRIILLEQIFRAFTIIQGKDYHHA